MPHNKNRNGIPDRWLDYQNVGKRIPGTRFISFKVPLKRALSRSLNQSEVFGPRELLDALEKQKEELGLIIDLTFTTRYYKLEDIPDSLLCVKIFTAGHEVPSEETILSFKQAVNSFLQDNKDNDKLIGVHCTHGLNRTGYLVCRYLIDVDGVDPKKAIELFNLSRGHTMERENYLKDLQSGPKRSNTGMKECKQEAQRGRAVCRPSSNHTDYREDRHSHSDNRFSHGPLLQRGWSHGLQETRGNHPPPHLSNPLPLPSPPPRSLSHWGQAQAHWRQPFYMEQSSRHRPSHPKPAWIQASHHNVRRSRDQRHPPASGSFYSNQTRYCPDDITDEQRGFYFDEVNHSRQTVYRRNTDSYRNNYQ
ncbi:RNA/RNP complex-1-interacting phosphatase [Merluccius polli]|uniref:RNA/RNP complex-1-interacting phosphatase n=1 Tax=Merluccius polli TaxID=89951 RepID=A0AA47NDU8_MERPO|nr:RNA/RNP complex-1-interacting phosphatase [Merluccius polli]